MRFVYNDGGRANAGYKGSTGDCVVRAIAIASELPYQTVYDELFERNRAFAARSRSRRAAKVRGKRGTPRDGNFAESYGPYLRSLGFVWTPTMRIGSGCTVHLRADELPLGRLVVHVSRHTVAVIDGVVHDTDDCTRNGRRCVYGYWRAA